MGDFWVLIIGGLIAVAVFFLCRELMCWYYKINRIIELMEEQNSLLRKQSGIEPAEENVSATSENSDNPIMYEVAYSTVLTTAPGTSFNVIKTIEKGVTLKYISPAGEWSLFETPEGEKGYCPMQDLKVL